MQPHSSIHKRRVPFTKNEKASYLVLRRKGKSINIIAKAFGRSTSVIHRALNRLSVDISGHNKTVWKSKNDLRKLPRALREKTARFHNRTMKLMFAAWEAFALGEGDRPP